MKESRRRCIEFDLTEKYGDGLRRELDNRIGPEPGSWLFYIVGTIRDEWERSAVEREILDQATDFRSTSGQAFGIRVSTDFGLDSEWITSIIHNMGLAFTVGQATTFNNFSGAS